MLASLGSVGARRHVAMRRSPLRAALLFALSEAACVPVARGTYRRKLNETLFPSLHHPRTTLTGWRADYDTERPHSRLGWLTPATFAQTFTPQRGLTPRNPQSSAPAPSAQPAQMGKTKPDRHSGFPNLLKADSLASVLRRGAYDGDQAIRIERWTVGAGRAPASEKSDGSWPDGFVRQRMFVGAALGRALVRSA